MNAKTFQSNITFRNPEHSDGRGINLLWKLLTNHIDCFLEVFDLDSSVTFWKSSNTEESDDEGREPCERRKGYTNC